MNLQTEYLGLPLRNPLVASASPLSRKLDNVRRMEDAGIAAVVCYSLFEEEIHRGELSLDHYQQPGTGDSARGYDMSPKGYLTHLEQLKAAVDIPIIGSLNGTTPGSWTEYARQIAQAGADALELNIYYVATDPDEEAGDVEDRYLDILTEVKSAIDIPIAFKLSPYFSSMANMARKLDVAGADGLVLFSRFHQPDIDLERLTVTPNTLPSTAFASRVPLRWIAILYGKVEANLAHTGGIYTHEDAIKSLLAGAHVTMTSSALLEHGIDHARSIISRMGEWLEQHKYEDVAQLRGTMSQIHCQDPAVFERANYIKALETYM